jgi:flagellar assembly protein FliH
VTEAVAEPFAYGTLGGAADELAHVIPFWPAAPVGAPETARSLPDVPARPSPDQQAQLAALEREAFTKGYAQGERAGLEAGAKRAEAMLRRVAQTIDELTGLRQRIIRDTERQLVQLAFTLAQRVVLREVTIQPDLVAALAHVALERLGDSTPATIRLNPEDYSLIAATAGEQWAGGHVTVAPDAAVPRGGCVVESDFGIVDAGVDAQFQELSRAVLGEQPVLGGLGDEPQL